MKQINFENVIIEGFRSIVKEKQFKLDDPGVTFISGKNGTGKTSIVEAVFWCLYGKSLKDSPGKSVVTWEHVRPADFKGTRVILDLTIDHIPYTIVRNINYKGSYENYVGKSTLMVFKAGNPMEDLYKSDVQATIIKLLQVDEHTFLNSVLFGQRVSRMMNASAKDQKEFFSQLFDLDYIDRAKAKAKEELELYNFKVSTVEHGMKSIADKLESLCKSEAMFKIYLDEFNSQVKDDLSKLQTEAKDIIDYKIELEDVLQELILKLIKPEEPEDDTAYYTAITDQNNELNKHQILVNNLTSRVASKQDLLSKFRSMEVTENCSKCGGPLDAELIAKEKKSIADNVETLEKELSVLTEERSEAVKLLESTISKGEGLKALRAQITHQREAYKLELDKYEKIKTRIKQVEQEIAVNESKFQGTQTAIERVNERKAPTFDYVKFELDKDAYELQIGTMEDELGALVAMRDYYDWWYKIGFSDSGLKFYIMDSMMDAFNGYLYQYSKALNIGVKVLADYTGRRKEFYLACNIKGADVDYSDISGGQKQRVDLILSLALYDLLSSRVVNFNCLIFDEAETGLDAEGVEVFFELLRMKTGKSIFIITHKLESDYSGCKVIEL